MTRGDEYLTRQVGPDRYRILQLLLHATCHHCGHAALQGLTQALPLIQHHSQRQGCMKQACKDITNASRPNQCSQHNEWLLAHLEVFPVPVSVLGISLGQVVCRQRDMLRTYIAGNLSCLQCQAAAIPLGALQHWQRHLSTLLPEITLQTRSLLHAKSCCEEPC